MSFIDKKLSVELEMETRRVAGPPTHTDSFISHDAKNQAVRNTSFNQFSNKIQIYARKGDKTITQGGT